MNKIENLLMLFTPYSTVHNDDVTLSFFMEKPLSLVMILSKTEQTIFLDICATDYSQKIQFDLPNHVIKHFLQQYVDNSHFLMKDMLSIDMPHLHEPLYQQLLHTFETTSFKDVSRFVQHEMLQRDLTSQRSTTPRMKI